MFSLKQLNPICTLGLILTAFCLSNCSENSEFGEASDYEKSGYSPLVPSGSGIIKGIKKITYHGMYQTIKKNNR